MDTAGGFFGELIEKGQNTTKATLSDLSSSTQGQFGLKKEPNGAVNKLSQTAPQDQNSPTDLAQASDSAQDQARTREMVKDFYAPSDDNITLSAQTDQGDLETQQKLAKARAELRKQHEEVYYKPLISYEEKQIHEEKPAERVERQEREEVWELEQKESKKPKPFDLAARRAMMRVEQVMGTVG